MCLSKEKPIEDKRDSFSHRVWDDLSEEILQYLPLEDKLRLEGVSKQFQRTVFEKFYAMDIRVYSDWNLKNLDLFLKKRSKLKAINKIEVKVVNQQNLIEIKRLVSNELFELIVNNCHQLSQIHCNWDWISIENRNKFVEKFGSTIVCLESFFIYHTMVWTNRPDLIIFDTKYKKLKKCGIDFMAKNAIEKFSEFVNSHKTTLRHLSVRLPPKFYTIDGQKFVLSQISKLVQLIELKIKFNYRSIDISFAEAFNQLAVNCRKLKSISTNLVIDSNEVSDMSQLLSPLRQFKHLRRLELTIEYNLIHSKNYMKSIFKYFKGLENLEYMTIFIKDFTLNGGPVLLTDIDINLPNLRYLKIKEAHIVANGTTPELLSRLSRLESIKIQVMDDSIADQIKSKLIQKCKKIRTIDITSCKKGMSNMEVNHLGIT